MLLLLQRNSIVLATEAACRAAKIRRLVTPVDLTIFVAFDCANLAWIEAAVAFHPPVLNHCLHQRGFTLRSNACGVVAAEVVVDL